MNNVRNFVLAALAFGMCSYATAAENFAYTATIDLAPVVTRSANFRTFNEFTDGLSTSGLELRFPGYNGTQRTAAQLTFTGLPMAATFPNVGFTGTGARLEFRVASLGIDEVFQGANRDDSVNLLIEYLKNRAGQIFNKLAQVSPGNPIAGNPNSLLSRMATTAFNAAFDPFSTNKISPDESGASPGLLGIGIGYGSYSGSGIATRAVTIPLSYTYRSSLDPRRQLSVNVPLTFSDVQGANTFTGSLGISYRFPVSDYWALAPNVAYGAVYSGDLGSAGHILSAGVTSGLYFAFDAFELTIGNMIGYYSTLNAPVRGYESNPRLRNWVFRNGVMISDQISLAGTKTVDLYFIDTRYTGSSMYNQYTNEIGIAIGTNRSANSSRSYFRGAIGYLFGPESRGWSISVGYWF